MTLLLSRPLGLLLALLPLLDAAFSYAGHGPAMRVTAVALFACAGGDVVVAALALAAAFVRGGNLADAEAKWKRAQSGHGKRKWASHP